LLLTVVCLIARAAIKESANRLGIVSVPLVTSEAEDRKLCAPICQGLSYWHFLKAQQVQVQPRIRSERHHPGVLPTLKHTITIAPQIFRPWVVCLSFKDIFEEVDITILRIPPNRGVGIRDCQTYVLRVVLQKYSWHLGASAFNWHYPHLKCVSERDSLNTASGFLTIKETSIKKVTTLRLSINIPKNTYFSNYVMAL